MKRKDWKCAYECGVGQDDLRLVGQDVELDDVAVAVPVDDFGVCGEEQKRKKQANIKNGHKRVRLFAAVTVQQVDSGISGYLWSDRCVGCALVSRGIRSKREILLPDGEEAVISISGSRQRCSASAVHQRE